MFISYAQNFEDVILWRALKHIENGVYIDVGAQDPIIDSVSRGFYESGWRGIHVEPTKTYAQKLRDDRPDEKVLQLAVGKGRETIQFFEIPQTGLSTGDSMIAEEHRQRKFEVIETKVPLIPLAKVLDDCAEPDIHWLKIDVEGMEKSVLESWAPSSKRPWIVVAESTRPLQEESSHVEWDCLLVEKGYQFVYFDGLNRFYVSTAHKELISSFGPGPNIFDQFSISGVASSPIGTLLQERVKEAADRVLRSEKMITEQGESLRALEIRCAELIRNNAELRSYLESLLDQVKAQAGVISHFEQEVSKLHSSYSWRITAPLRHLNRVRTRVTLGASAWLMLKQSSRPRRIIREFITRAMLWTRQRPIIFTFILKILHFIPALERRVLASAHSRGLALSYSPSASSTVRWETDVDPQLSDKWQNLLK